MDRREFLIKSAIVAASTALTGAKSSKGLDRLTVLSWSFRDAFANTRSKNGWVPEKDLDILDYPEMIADTYQIHKLEIQTMYLQPEASFIAELNKRLKKAKSRVVNIAGEPHGDTIKNIGSANEKGRAEAIEVYKGWIDYAAQIGSPNLMINQGDLYDDVNPLIDSGKKLAAYGHSKKVVVSAEPRGTSGRQPEIFVKVLRESGMRATVDIGNFSDEARERGIRLLMPLAANTCHIKYNPARYDFATIMKVVEETGYSGLYTIEAGFHGDPYQEVRIERDEILKYA
jgi:sugar phosphate isomerase/epimerase